MDEYEITHNGTDGENIVVEIRICYNKQSWTNQLLSA